MKKAKRIKTLLFAFLCLMLIAATALTLTACNKTQEPLSYSIEQTVTKSTIVGKGDTEFPFTVINPDGTKKVFTVKTNSEYVGKALIDVGLISGDDGEYGLYVKTVDGLTLDYDTDGKYWAFYINDEYANTGVDKTPILEGNTYCFKGE